MLPFLRSRKLLLYTHAWTNIHKLSLALIMSLFMALTWSELNYCSWSDGTVCEQPARPQSFSVDPSARSSFTEHVCKFEHPFIQFKFSVYGHKQASRHTHAHAQCSHASVGLAQARSNDGPWKTTIREPFSHGAEVDVVICARPLSSFLLAAKWSGQQTQSYRLLHKVKLLGVKEPWNFTQDILVEFYMELQLAFVYNILLSSVRGTNHSPD